MSQTDQKLKSSAKKYARQETTDSDKHFQTVAQSFKEIISSDQSVKVRQGTGIKYTGKRVTDLLIGSIAAILFLMLLPFIAIGIKLNSRGPVFFKQKRTGVNGREFICYKFRTMHFLQLKRYDGKPVVTQKNDKRIFWFGKILRKTNLDELPQIINVMKGEMSLIGPRPYPVKECKYWNNTFDDFYYRYSVLPGISGLAQVNGYRGGTLDESLMSKRLDYDLIYVEKQSFFLDLNILFRTVFKMINFDTDAH